MLKNKGFTLVELLATLVLIGLLAVVAAPNIVGVLESNRKSTYLEDAKKLVTLAEYRLKGNNDARVNINKFTGDNKCIGVSLSYLGEGEFRTSPNTGNGYENEKSYVIIRKSGANYEYYVQLAEKTSNDGYTGIKLTKKDNLKSGSNNVKTFKSNEVNNFATSVDTSVVSCSSIEWVNS